MSDYYVRRLPEHEWTLGNDNFFSFIRLARPKGVVLEVVPMSKKRPLVEVIDFFVHPERRGRGWANRLMNSACEWADKQGAALVLRACVEGRAPNTKRMTYRQLKKFYNRFGFRTVPVRDPNQLTYDVPLDCVMVRRPQTVE